MKALVLSQENKDRLKITDLERPILASGQALIKIKAAALNHRDQWCREGLYPNLTEGVALGSDGSGTVEEVFDKKDVLWKGREVIINPAMNWGDNPAAHSPSFEILGMPSNGTFEEYVAVPVDRLVEKPKHLTSEEAASLPLGGLTAYRALFTCGNVEAGKKVLISGVGGGVAQFAFQFAVAAGSEVYATSGSEGKLEKVRHMGAAGTYNYKNKGWEKEALKETGGFDLIIDSAGGDFMNNLLRVTKPGGKIVFFGATTGIPSGLDLRRIFWNHITLQGTTMGTDEEFNDMVDFVAKKEIRPIVDSVVPFENIISQFDKMQSGKMFGKLVVRF
ncbi:quinone oxidoreductase family protein [Xanthovirga aplysinae]|uniref:quinone oxidoreductase family protein n=1 Tax=Xanthovirga aplysinae TaxID=2529853 RepID=UPI0012BB9042|nr:zinc-binding dehydrogenase [Xanthovirga aplysinae]MTI32118.1 alcohol dehydrogenase [Xanthovirga aplysinae]